MDTTLQPRSAAPPSSSTLTALLLGLTAIYIAVVVAMMQTTSYDIWPGMIIGPLLVALTLPMLSRQAKRENSRRVYHFLAWALVVKMLFTIVRYYITFSVFGAADAVVYHRYGVALSDNFRSGFFTVDLPMIPGRLGPLDELTRTDFIRFLTGIFYTGTGPTKLGGFLLFSWIAFIGLFYFYRAFQLAVPEGRARTYGWLVFFFPSMLYWPSSIGKESWMIFTLGIAAFGAAKMLKGSLLQGLLIAAPALYLGGIVRAHVPALLALSLVVAFIARRPSQELRQLAPLVKLTSLAVVLAAAVLFVGEAEEFLRTDLDSASSVTTALESTSEKSAQGGSEFKPVVVRGPEDVPLAMATTLFRPLPTEANNGPALAAAAESMMLVAFSLWRIKWLWAGLKSFRRQPFVVLSASYVLVFAIAFASLPNFGLLARQRVQMLPLYFVLFAIPWKAKTDDNELAAP